MNDAREFRYRWRFDAKPLVRDAMQVLDNTEVTRVLSSVSTGEWSDERQADIADATFDEVVARLDATGVPRDERVFVVWRRPAPSVGVLVPFGLFRDNWDDFWYPSSDDAILVDESISTVVRFDHEERIVIARSTKDTTN